MPYPWWLSYVKQLPQLVAESIYNAATAAQAPHLTDDDRSYFFRELKAKAGIESELPPDESEEQWKARLGNLGLGYASR